MSGDRATNRFSGHESFVCRYGWLPKVYRAVKSDASLLRDDERATPVSYTHLTLPTKA